MQVCSNCQRAPLATGDRYCFVCSAKLRDVKLDVKDEFVVIRPGAAEPEWRQGVLRNTGQFGVEVGLAPPDVAWLTLFPSEGDAPLRERWTLAPDDEAHFRVQVRPDGALTGPMTATLRVADGDGYFRDVLQHIHVLPPPRLEVVLDGGAVVEMAQTVGPELYGDVRVTSGSGARVVDVTPDPTVRQWASARMKGERLALAVELAGLREALGPERPSHVTVPLCFRLEDLPVPVEHAIELPLRWPASLRITARYAKQERALGGTWSLVAGRYHILSLLLGNSGGSVLTLRQISIASPDVPLYWIEAPPDGKHHWEISPRADPRVLRCVIDLRERDTPFEVTLTVLSDSPDEEEHRVQLRIEPVALEAFSGAVGLDFGTSNSCIALWPEHEGHPVPASYADTFIQTAAEKPSRDGTVASNILYHARISEGLRDRTIGHTLAPNDACLIHSVKRHLGEGGEILVPFIGGGPAVPLTAAEVAGDILQSLLWDAETALGRRITGCVLTHPVRFATRQIRALVDMLRGFGLNVESLLPEPVAAAIDFAVSDPAPPPFPRDYHLLVFDIGGGTTDIALLRIRDIFDEEANIRIIAPTLLAANGHRWAGGDDITWSVLEFALQTLDPKIVAQELGLTPETLAMLQSGLRSRDPVAWWTNPGLNRAFTVADTVKEARSNEEWGNGDMMIAAGGFLPDAVALRHIADSFYDVYELEALARKTLADGQITEPDTVLLVGQTWRIKRLVERIAAAFPGSRIHPTDGNHLKLPVARGACRAHQFADEEYGYRLDPTGLESFVTSRIGLVRGDKNTSERMFFEVIRAQHRIGEWGRIPGTVRPDRAVKIYENTGYDDSVFVEKAGSRRPNREIQHIGTLTVSSADLEGFSEEEIAAGTIELCVNREHVVLARLNIGGQKPPILITCVQ